MSFLVSEEYKVTQRAMSRSFSFRSVDAIRSLMPVYETSTSFSYSRDWRRDSFLGRDTDLLHLSSLTWATSFFSSPLFLKSVPTMTHSGIHTTHRDNRKLKAKIRKEDTDDDELTHILHINRERVDTRSHLYEPSKKISRISNRNYSNIRDESRLDN